MKKGLVIGLVLGAGLGATALASGQQFGLSIREGVAQLGLSLFASVIVAPGFSVIVKWLWKGASAIGHDPDPPEGTLGYSLSVRDLLSFLSAMAAIVATVVQFFLVVAGAFTGSYTLIGIISLMLTTKQ